MTVKINTKDGQIELSDDVIATVVAVQQQKFLALSVWQVRVLSEIIFKHFLERKTTQKELS